MARSYKININDLLNIDEPFLYENEHFCGLVRRVHNLYPTLLNPNYEIDAAILKPKAQIDDKYKAISENVMHTWIGSQPLNDYKDGLFHCNNSFADNAFDTIMNRYEKLFNLKKKLLEERLSLFQDFNTVWETLEIVYK